MAIGDKTPIPEDNAFGTSGEISAREHTAKQNEATTFKQPGPEDSGGNVAKMDQNATSRSGRMKWSGQGS